MPSAREIKDLITSVHVNFIGKGARIGFRFDVPHAASPFGCTQDELNDLRSKRFPRQAEDQKFLEAARRWLVESFTADRQIRILAVDVGTSGAHAAVYNGKSWVQDVPLKIIKINQRYDRVPDTLVRDPRDRKMRGPLKLSDDDSRGLRVEHVRRHLGSIALRAAEITQRRSSAGKQGKFSEHDLRKHKRHIRWMIRDWARHNAAQIIRTAEENRCDLIVFESLRAFGCRAMKY